MFPFAMDSIIFAILLSTCQARPSSPGQVPGESTSNFLRRQTINNSTSIFSPTFPPQSPPPPENPGPHSLISHLELEPNPEGGYFRETDRDPLRIPNPFSTLNPFSLSSQSPSQGLISDTRSASTTIYYHLTPSQPRGVFHRIKARNIHTWHRGRGRYVIIHADLVANPKCSLPLPGYGCEDLTEEERWVSKARIETFVVGGNVTAGERQQWVVEGGKYKSSFLLADEDGGNGSEEGLLISETVVPGFEYVDHDYLGRDRMEALLTEGEIGELEWLLRENMVDGT